MKSIYQLILFVCAFVFFFYFFRLYFTDIDEIIRNVFYYIFLIVLRALWFFFIRRI